MAVVFLYQITVFCCNCVLLQFCTTKHNTISFGTLFNDSMQTVYDRGGGRDGSQQREVADGVDVVFTDTRDRQGRVRMGLKIEIHEIHQNLRHPVSINRPTVSETCLN